MEQEQKLKILVAHNYYQLSGGEDSVVTNEIGMLRANGHEVLLYSRNNNEINTFSWLRKLILPFTAIFSMKSYRDVKRLIKENKIDILHVHNTLTLLSPSVYYAAWHSGIPVVQTIHNFRMICPNALLYRDGHVCEDCLKYGFKCALKNRCYRNSFSQTFVSACVLMFHRMIKTYKRLHYICLTDFNKKMLLTVKQISEEKVYVKPNFVKNQSEIIPFSKRKKQFVFVGRPEKVKGIEILLEAWGKIKEYDLIICGTSDDLHYYKQYIQNNGLSNVQMLGFVRNETVRKILSESLALIFPTQLYEGFPMTIIEALSCGTPVIGSDIGNVGKLVKTEKIGQVFRADSASDLVNKIYDTEKREMVTACFKTYYTRFSEESNYKLLMNVYKSMF